MNSKKEDSGLFQRFMNAYSSISGKKYYEGSLDKVKDADALIILGTRIVMDDSVVYDALKNASKCKSAKIMYAHPIEDVAMKNVATQFMKYEPGSEEGVLALLAYYLLAETDLSQDERKFLDDLDLAYLEAESNVGEEELEGMIQSFQISKNKVFIIGNDVMAHERAENIARLCALIEKNSEFSLLVVPDEMNKIDRSLISSVGGKLEEIKELPEYNGCVIYHSNFIEGDGTSLHGSAQFARAAKISDGDYISISFDGQTINREFKVEDDLKGTIALNPTFDIAIDEGKYKFQRSEINKINQKSENNNE